MIFYLIGFMGSGKSSAGRFAARKCGVRFIDLDEWIEAREGKKVREIFKEKGEEGFREIEWMALHEVSEVIGDTVVSTGGGTPCFFDNMEYMKSKGITIFLDLSSARLTDRLRNSLKDRPLLEEAKGDLQTFIHQKLVERAPFYSQAEYTLHENEASREGLRDLIRKLLAVSDTSSKM
jgi:shikimate kinase